MNLPRRLTTISLTAAALASIGPAPVRAQATTGTKFTTTTATVETIIDTPVTQQVNAYSTELTAQMQGGPVLYDQTFPVAFADPIFQSAISTAESVLTGAGAVSILGPTLTSSTNSSSSTTQTVQTGSTSNVSLATTVF